MFERFTDRARRVVVLAQEEARLLNHNYIGTEHLLLGLIDEDEGVAAMALEALGVSVERARAQVEEIIGVGPDVPSGHIPFTPRAKKVLEMSLREALQLHHNHIGTEHILLGLLREGEGVGAQVLVKLGADLESTRAAVLSLLEGRPPLTTMAGPGPVSGFGLQSGGRRCGFCLRSEDRVARLVRGRTAFICDECLARAGALVAEAGEEGPKQLRLRRPFLPLAQTEAAEDAVERAFETVFGGGATVDERLALIQDSGLLYPVVEQVMELGQRAGDPEVWVDFVRFISTDEAEVHWSPTLVGGGRIPLHGFAVLDGDVWKVSRATYHQMASMAGVPVPPPDPGDPAGPGAEPPGA